MSMKKPFSAEPRAEQALRHERILHSSLTAVASKRGAVDAVTNCDHSGRPAPPPDPPPAGRTSQTEGRRYTRTVDAEIGAGGGHFLYRWAAMNARTDSPGVAELEAQGWTVEHIDPRYQTRLMRKEIPDALPRASRARDCGDVDPLHAARDLVLRARSRTPHLALVGIAALLAALVLLGCALLAVEAWRRVESAAHTDETRVSAGER